MKSKYSLNGQYHLDLETLSTAKVCDVVNTGVETWFKCVHSHCEFQGINERLLECVQLMVTTAVPDAKNARWNRQRRVPKSVSPTN